MSSGSDWGPVHASFGLRTLKVLPCSYGELLLATVTLLVWGHWKPLFWSNRTQHLLISYYCLLCIHSSPDSFPYVSEIGLLNCRMSEVRARGLSLCPWLVSLNTVSTRTIHVSTDDRISIFQWLNNVPLCISATFPTSVPLPRDAEVSSLCYRS